MPGTLSAAMSLTQTSSGEGDGDDSTSSFSSLTSQSQTKNVPPASRALTAFVAGSKWRASPPAAEITLSRPRGAPSTADIDAATSDSTPRSSLACPYDDDMHYEPGVCTDNWGITELVESADVYSRDFAELSATIRVLSLGLEPATPLLDRLKFLCIVSSLLDEHFVQRLGAIERTDVHDFRSSRLSLRRQIRPRTPHEDKFDIAIRAVVRDQHACLIGEVLPALAVYGVRVVSWDEMLDVEKAKAQGYFERFVKHTLTPLVFDPAHPFPIISSHAVYLCVLLRPKAPEREEDGVKNGGEKDAWKGAKCGSSGSGGGAVVPVQHLFLRMPLEGWFVQVDGAGLWFLLVEYLVRAFLERSPAGCRF